MALVFRANRLILSAVLTFAAGGSLSAQEPDDWRRLLNEGNQAEDAAEYKKSQELFARACESALRTSLRAEAKRTACVRLAQTQAIVGDLKEADKTLSELVGQLRIDDSPSDLAEALFEWADVRAARSKLASMADILTELSRLTSKLPRLERFTTMSRLAQFFLTVGMTDPGMALLDQIQAELLITGFSLTDHKSVNALSVHAGILAWNKRFKEAESILRPIVAAANARFESSEDVSEELRKAYWAAGNRYTSVLNALKREDSAKAHRADMKKWKAPEAELRRKAAMEGVQTPRVLHKPDPTYTPGALDARAQGDALVNIEIWEDGRPHKIRVIRRLPYGLTWKAVASIRTWRFRPGEKEGKPVKHGAAVKVSFRLRSP